MEAANDGAFSIINQIKTAAADPSISAEEFRVWAVAALSAGPDGKSWKAVETIAKEAATPKRTTERALSSLRNKDQIQRTRKGRASSHTIFPWSSDWVRSANSGGSENSTQSANGGGFDPPTVADKKKRKELYNNGGVESTELDTIRKALRPAAAILKSSPDTEILERIREGLAGAPVHLLRDAIEQRIAANAKIINYGLFILIAQDVARYYAEKEQEPRHKKPKTDCEFCRGLGWKMVTQDGIEGAARCDCVVSPASTEDRQQVASPAVDPEHPGIAQTASDTRESANALGDISEEIARAAELMRMPARPAQASYDQLVPEILLTLF